MFKGEVTRQAINPTLTLTLNPNQVTRQAISAICANYRAGDPDPREPGTCMQVRASIAHDYGLCYTRLQPLLHTVTASITYGYSQEHACRFAPD